MFDEFRGGAPLRSVYWKDLRPGLVFAGGLSINGSLPPELAGFPVLDARLIGDLRERYRLKPEHRILALGDDGGLSPRELSEALRKTSERLPRLNGLRQELRRRKESQPDPARPVWESAWVERGSLVWNLPEGGPSLFSELSRDIGLAEVLSREAFTRFALPEDLPATLHLVVDLSYSMEASGKDGLTKGVARVFRDLVARTLPLAEILVYGFSERCRLVEGILTCNEVERAGTDFSSFARAIRKRRREGRPEAVILLTDGLPEKRSEAEASLRELARAGLRYTQVVMGVGGERRRIVEAEPEESRDGYFVGKGEVEARELGEEEYQEREASLREGFHALARAAEGNQMLVMVDEAAGIAAVEIFDRWYGGLSS